MAAVILRLRCGCFQNPQGNPVGYFDLDIHYREVDLTPSGSKALKEAGQERVEVLYDEIGREPDDLFSHRFLCSGFAGRRRGEMAVRFRGLELVRTPREDRHGKLGWPCHRYVEIPAAIHQDNATP